MPKKYLNAILLLQGLATAIGCKPKYSQSKTASNNSGPLNITPGESEFEDALKLEMVDVLAKEAPLVSLKDPELLAYDSFIYNTKPRNKPIQNPSNPGLNLDENPQKNDPQTKTQTANSAPREYFSDRSADQAAAKKLHTLFNSGLDGFVFEARKVVDARFRACYGFDDCANKISAMSTFIIFYSSTLDDPKPLLNGLKSHIAGNAGINQPLLIDILNFRIDVLAEFTAMYHDAQLDRTDNTGNTPYMQRNAYDAHMTKANELVQTLTGKLKIAPKSKFIENIKDAYSGYYRSTLDISNSAKYSAEADDLMPKDDELQQIANSQYAALGETYVGLLNEKLYLERLILPNPTAWLSDLVKRIDAGSIKPRTAFLCLNTFGSFEVKGAFGKPWVDTLETIVKKYHDSDPSMMEVVQLFRGNLEGRQGSLKKYFDGEQFSWGNYGLEPVEEQKLAAMFPAFRSNQYHLNKVARGIAARNEKLKKINVESPSKEDLEAINVLDDDVTAARWTHACFIYLAKYRLPGAPTPRTYARYQNNEGSKLSLYPSKARARHEAIDPDLACTSTTNTTNNMFDATYEQLSSDALKVYFKDITDWNQRQTPERNVNAFVTRMRIAKIWGPVKFEIAITTASAVMTIFTLGASTAVGAAVTTAATKLAARAAIDATVKWTASWLTVQTLRVLTEAVAFSVLNRVVNNAAITVYAGVANNPNYLKARKSMFASYTRELIYGIPAFAFLPRIGAISSKWATRLATRIESSGAVPVMLRSSVTDLILTGADLGSVGGTLMTQAQIGAQIEHILSRKQGDPLFKAFDGSEFKKMLLHTSYVLLAFRAYQGGHTLETNLAEGDLNSLLAEEIAIESLAPAVH